MGGIGLQIGPLRGGVFVETGCEAVGIPSGIPPGALLAACALPARDVGDLQARKKSSRENSTALRRSRRLNELAVGMPRRWYSARLRA
jgi:hypothetical protein